MPGQPMSKPEHMPVQAPHDGTSLVWDDPNAFRDAVAQKMAAFRIPGKDVDDRAIFTACKDAFVSFAVKFGQTLFVDGVNSSAHSMILELTLTPKPDGTAEDKKIGENFGALAGRYMDLRFHVGGPYVVHSVTQLSAASRRFKLWRNGWEAADGYRELTPYQQVMRSPAIPFTSNWIIFMHLSVQYTMMEMLFYVFWKVAQDFSLNPLSWNNPQSATLTHAVETYTAAIKGSLVVANVKKREVLGLSAVSMTTELVKAFANISAGSLLGMLPNIVKNIAAIQNVSGKVKIGDNLATQLANQVKAEGDVPPAIRLVFDDLVNFAAVLRLYSDNHLVVPQYLLNGGRIPGG